MAKTQEQANTSAATEVLINFPVEGERITSFNYVFRIETKMPGTVELAIDQNEWHPCRQAGGYWWYDWSGYSIGKHRAVARIQPVNAGKRYTSRALNFKVEQPKP